MRWFPPQGVGIIPPALYGATVPKRGRAEELTLETNQIDRLRQRQKAIAWSPARAHQALQRFGRIWQQRLQDGWTPPEDDAFPWPQVRLSLSALVSSLPQLSAGEENNTGIVALILAGNTPLLGWPALIACVQCGAACVVKMSRDETLWPRLFVETLSAADPDLATRFDLNVWPGDDRRTADLCQAADLVIAYGGDPAITALRAVTPPETPFLSFGHAISVGLATNPEAAGDFAPDILLYNQSGCLSAQAVFVMGGADEVQHAAASLARALPAWTDLLELPPVNSPGVARQIREARDLALFDGATVLGDARLRWTIIHYLANRKMPPPVGSSVVSLIALSDPATQLSACLNLAPGQLSSVGVAGSLTYDLRGSLLSLGVSRICPAGRMQMPPIHWPNGKRDLLASLRKKESVSAMPLVEI